MQHTFSLQTVCLPASAWWCCQTDRDVGLTVKLMTWWHWGNFEKIAGKCEWMCVWLCEGGCVWGHAHCSAASGCLQELAPDSWMNHLLHFFYLLVLFAPLLFFPPLVFFLFVLSAENFTEATGLGKDNRQAQCVSRLMHHIRLLSSNTKQQCRPLTLESTHILSQKPVDFLSLLPINGRPFWLSKGIPILTQSW